MEEQPNNKDTRKSTSAAGSNDTSALPADEQQLEGTDDATSKAIARSNQPEDPNSTKKDGQKGKTMHDISSE